MKLCWGLDLRIRTKSKQYAKCVDASRDSGPRDSSEYLGLYPSHGENFCFPQCFIVHELNGVLCAANQLLTTTDCLACGCQFRLKPSSAGWGKSSVQDKDIVSSAARVSLQHSMCPAQSQVRLSCCMRRTFYLEVATRYILCALPDDQNSSLRICMG